MTSATRGVALVGSVAPHVDTRADNWPRGQLNQRARQTTRFYSAGVSGSPSAPAALAVHLASQNPASFTSSKIA